MYTRFVATLIALSVASQSAASSCWSKEELSATKIRTLDEMLMVSSLRCRLVGVEFQNSYGEFVSNHRGKLMVAALTLQRRMISADTYDRFITSIANRYGAGVPGMSCTDLAELTRAAADPQRALADLEDLAERAGVGPATGEASCDAIAKR